MAARHAENMTKVHIHNRATLDVVSRTTIAAANLCVLLVFVAVELGFSHFHFATPLSMLLVAAGAVVFRCAELMFSRRRPATHPKAAAIVSIAFGLVLPFLLAAATRQFHTHYFGLLIMPTLETALYFQLGTTLAVAALSGGIALFWVAYAARFQTPFQLGELLEATTMVLVLLVVAPLVWNLLDLLNRRDAQLAERLRDLEDTRAQLVEGEKLAAVGRLASAVAHEIRNPVAIISSALEVAASPAFAPHERDEMSRVALLEAKRLEKLTSDFLTYAQPNSLPETPVDAAALSSYLGSIARAQAMTRQVKFDIAAVDGCVVMGNEDQLQRALINLMRNAIDASPEGGRVGVQVTQVAGKVRIAIENAGPAIPDYAVPRIFEPFFTAKRGGTGLGLSIARKVVEAHHGELILETNASDKVVFALLLPRLVQEGGG
jgi:signal transduction histidine kinase